MDFFERQDRARRNTTKLVVLFCLSVFAIVIFVNLAVFAGTKMYIEYYRHTRVAYDPDFALSGRTVADSPLENGQLLIATTVVTLLIITGGSAYKMMALSGGGPSVAQMLGGRILGAGRAQNQTQEAILQNVVEEMSIASGVPVPQVYVLDHEEGINAFAAGFTTSDAVIGVTRGTLEKLNRDELQGVIGHEFSHILNGDMRLNLRLIGLLNGILVVSLIGLALFRAIQFMPLSRGGGRHVVTTTAPSGWCWSWCSWARRCTRSARSASSWAG